MKYLSKIRPALFECLIFYHLELESRDVVEYKTLKSYSYFRNGWKDHDTIMRHILYKVF